jgi:prolyl-tRNA editing enzyme YbaK/EbsC (Cys-tRNA(Pro) deacylase)
MVQHHPAVSRVRDFMTHVGHPTDITILDDSARTAREAADALGIAVGQIASSIVFGLPVGAEVHPLLVITSGQHRVDTEKVALHCGVSKLIRADAEFVRQWSGFAIGGVSPFAWLAANSSATTPHGYPSELTILIDTALAEYDEVWAAAGHPHSVFPTSFEILQSVTGATSLAVGQRA